MGFNGKLNSGLASGKLGNPRTSLLEAFEWENITMTVFTYIYIYTQNYIDRLDRQARQMDGSIDGSMDRWKDGQMDGQMNRWIDEQMDRWIDKVR